MSGEYISRENITERLERVIEHGVPNTMGTHSITAEATLEVIRDIPAADVVERKVGHWIFHPEQKNIYGGKLIECSECRTQYLVMNVVEEIYCRHCGSKNQNGGQDDV